MGQGERSDPPRTIGGGRDARAAVLLVSEDPRLERELFGALGDGFGARSRVADATTAAASTHDADGAIVFVDGRSAQDLRSLQSRPGLAVVLIDRTGTREAAVEAVRSGASDVIAWPEERSVVGDRAAAVLDRVRSQRTGEQRAERLGRLCHKLNAAREEVAGSVGELASDLLGAYRELSDQVGEIALASELDSLLRQELEVDSLLRTFLEFVLARVGSTNAGVFLPGHSGDWSLGAYINFDVPRDQAEPMLDELASTLAPAFAGRAGVARLETPEAFEDELGESSHWMGGRAALVRSCDEAARVGSSEPETLAVIALFRSARAGYSERDERTLGVAAELFGQQLSRVIRVHHRAGPSDGGLDDPDDGFGDGFDDLAA